MSRLPRGPATTTAAAATALPVPGSIRPPASGMALPRSLANNDFMSDLPALAALPALTQRVQAGTRRATVATPTPTLTSPPAETLGASGRPSAIAARNMSGGSVSPSPGASNADHTPSLVFRTPPPSASRDGGRLNSLSRSLARSPTRDLISPQASDSHDGFASGRTSRGGGLLTRSSEAITPGTLRPGSDALHMRNASCSNEGGSVAGLRCGDPVFIPLQGLQGRLRYLGPIDGKQGTWAGVELDEVGKGKNDGTAAGKVYFACPKNTGLFLAPSKVEPISSEQGDFSDSNGDADGDEEHMRTIASVLSTPTGDARASQDGSQSATVNRTVRLSTISLGLQQRTQPKQPGRVRMLSDTQPSTGLPPVARGSSNNGSSSGSLASTAHNRRTTLSRTTPVTAGSAAPDAHASPSRSRAPPPATLARGPSRPRPASTASSIISNRTVSPPLSRPNSRSLVPTGNDQPATAPNGARSTALGRTQSLGGDMQASASTAAARRRIVPAVSTRPPEIAAKALGAGPRTKATGSTDPVDRLRLRVDMLEAENRVLRLKNEQDKAHLAAGQMLARDLVSVNGPMSPQMRGPIDGTRRLSLLSPAVSSAATDFQGSSSMSELSQQLGDTHQLLERERKDSQAQIASLESQISELRTHMAEINSGNNNNANASDNVEGAHTDEEELVSAEATREISARIVELEAQLAQAAQDHASELASVAEAQSEVNRALEQHSADVEALQASLGVKASELSSLSTRFDRVTADLARANQLYEELVSEQQQKQADDSSEESELIASLKKQVEKLRRDCSGGEERLAAMTEHLEAETLTRSEAEAKFASALLDMEGLENRASDYNEKTTLVSQCHSCLCDVALLAQQHSGDFSVEDGPDHLAALNVAELFSVSKERVSRLADRLRDSLGRATALSEGIESRDVQIAELAAALEEAKRGVSQAASKAIADEGDASSSESTSTGDLQSRVDELECQNSKLVEERIQFIQDQAIFNDYLEKLESECNRLVEDIEQLTFENHKLTDELRAFSLHNSTVSLDFSAIDAKLAGEPAHTDDHESAGSVKQHTDGSDSSNQKSSFASVSADVDAAQQRHQREIAVLQSRLADLENRKSSEIKKLQDEIGNLEDLVEDKIFSESEMNDKISMLTDEVDRLQREIKRMRSSDPATAVSASSSPAVSSAADRNAKTSRHATGAGASKHSPAALTANGVISEDDGEDDEPMYCDICDVDTHRIADCPEITGASSTTLKHESSIDSSRPYCDNCELFADHWTDECPHGDEMF
ncbi:hypothetical protein LPJ66_007726 [Kickxella alabastrina]|uniref:Uncharacterized protein n=1 Tax=Kickxella alabastrina TaxID=61397 RepID=A0ACC1I896_9FUNG|nr:hypothetical protein LPJ66_007726 [Kickxella alabastrina]